MLAHHLQYNLRFVDVAAAVGVHMAADRAQGGGGGLSYVECVLYSTTRE